ncbi:MAG: prolyl oligopeptidase family serine peptidase [Promethearchaeota archaeon]
MIKFEKINVLKIIMFSICVLTFIVGIYFTAIVLFEIPSSLAVTLSYFLSQISGFLTILYILTTILLLKLLSTRYKKSWISKIVLIFGLILALLNSLPLISTPFSIQNAENEFDLAYGSEWRSKISNQVESYMSPSQFNLYGYFLGFPIKDCNVDVDVLYYDNDGVKLYFDVYYPKGDGSKLPGNNSVIIKIHGGSWQFGDKSLGNVLVLNKYLAAQGYVVFDIQYGLLDAGGSSFIPTPDYVRGNITLSDMIYQIGNFTKKLENKYASRYNANLNSVFIMGGSAGGHLTAVCGLGYNDPYFAGNFSNALNIKGIIPIYPPNFAARYFDDEPLTRLIPGDPISNPLAYAKYTPSNLIDASDPPALIFQGLRDDLVSLDNAEMIKSTLNINKINCMLLTFPFAAHASDLIVGNSYSQVWVYYLERFLYISQISS